MDEDGQAERLGLAPERVERKLAEVHVLDVGGDDDADRAEFEPSARSSAAAASASVSGTDEIHEKRLALSAVHSASVSLSMRCQAMQCGERQAIAEDVRPGADDLVVDLLFVHPLVAFRDRLDQRGKNGRTLKP